MSRESGGISKLVIKAYSDNKFTSSTGEYAASINPEDINISSGIDYHLSQGMGAPGTLRYNTSRPKVLSFKLLFDNTGIIPGAEVPVEEQLQQLRKVIYDVQENINAPYYVRVIWGIIDFKGRLADLDINYIKFKAEGLPIRAEAFVRVIEEKEAPANLKSSSKAASTSPLEGRDPANTHSGATGTAGAAATVAGAGLAAGAGASGAARVSAGSAAGTGTSGAPRAGGSVTGTGGGTSAAGVGSATGVGGSVTGTGSGTSAAGVGNTTGAGGSVTGTGGGASAATSAGAAAGGANTAAGTGGGANQKGQAANSDAKSNKTNSTAATNNTKVHEVKAGESLPSISNSALGTPNLASSLGKLNGLNSLRGLPAGLSLAVPFSLGALLAALLAKAAAAAKKGGEWVKDKAGDAKDKVQEKM